MLKPARSCFWMSLMLLALLPACGGTGQPGPLALASATQNHVTVTIALERDAAGTAWLAATFTPDDPSFHLYSQDLPRQGIDGLGRPTLVELPAGARLQAAGGLRASVQTVPGVEGLPVYPAGPVTLRLPVRLPAGKGWFDEQASVTYMACSDNACLPPVENKLIAIRIPGEEDFH